MQTQRYINTQKTHKHTEAYSYSKAEKFKHTSARRHNQTKKRKEKERRPYKRTNRHHITKLSKALKCFAEVSTLYESLNKSKEP